MLPVLHREWVTVPSGLLGLLVPASDSASLSVLPSWLLLLHLWGHAAVVPSHLPPHRLHHGLADQGLCGRPQRGHCPQRCQVTCTGMVVAFCFPCAFTPSFSFPFPKSPGKAGMSPHFTNEDN